MRFFHASPRAFIPMQCEVTSATSRGSRILLRAMDALSYIPDLLTVYLFEELLKIIHTAEVEGRDRLALPSPSAPSFSSSFAALSS